jgi:L-threonylcarbamoyladenylate synthase
MAHSNGGVFKTRILPVDTQDLGKFNDRDSLEKWELPSTSSPAPLRKAAQHLKSSDIPVGFPTETVYGLGADATRSAAVKGIYKAKGRPSDNPLIIHICDLTMLRSLLIPATETYGAAKSADPIPEIYKPLIRRFWPGPLTILLPNPSPSKLAPEVTAGLPSFGARMPDLPLALSLIHLAGVPLAAPSANASTKPSPTTAQHVLHDLKGRIEIILDGGACQVGVESTVVDGLCDPPVVLRPGGVSIDRIRECEGWEGVVKGYKDQSEVGASAPRAPGMKYKHYSPKAKVVLYEAAASRETEVGRGMNRGIPLEILSIVYAHNTKDSGEAATASIGIVSTKHWTNWAGFHGAKCSGDGRNQWTKILKEKTLYTMELGTSEDAKRTDRQSNGTILSPFEMRSGELWQGWHPPKQSKGSGSMSNGSHDVDIQMPPESARSVIYDDESNGLRDLTVAPGAKKTLDLRELVPELVPSDRYIANIIEISLGAETKDIAHGLFSALRELDQRDVDVIYVEGIEDEGDIAAAVMNRLRKAAAVIERC